MSASRTRHTLELVGCPCTGETLDKLVQPAILAILAKGAMHGYGLAEHIGAMPGFRGHKPDVSGIYRLLKAMEERDLVVSAWDLAEAGPARKTYQITPRGRDCLRRWIGTLEEYRKGITALLSTAKKALISEAGDRR